MKILRKIGIAICVIVMTFIVLFNVNEVMFKTENERINIFGYKLMNIDNKYDYYLVKETKVKDIILYDNVSFRVADSYKDFNRGLVKGKINDCLKLKDNNTVVCDNNLEGKVVMKISGARNLLFVNKGSIIILIVCSILLILVFLWKPGKKKKKAVEDVKTKEENNETSEIKEEFEKSENSDNQTIIIDTTPFDSNRNEMISNNENNQTVVVEPTVTQEEIPVEEKQTIVVEPPVQEEVPMEETVNEPIENNQTVVIEPTMPQEESVNGQTIVIGPVVSSEAPMDNQEIPMNNQFEVSQEETPVIENQVEVSQMEVPVDTSQVIAIDPNPMKEEIKEEVPVPIVKNEMINNDVQEFDNYNVNVNEIDLSKFSGDEVKPIEEAHFEFSNDVTENVSPFDNTEIEEDRMIQAGDLDDVAEPTESYQSEIHEEFMEEATPIVEAAPEISSVEPIETTPVVEPIKTTSVVEPIEEKVQEEPVEVEENNMDFSNYIFEKVQNTTVDNVTMSEEKESPNINNIFENKGNTVEINVDEILEDKPKKVKVTPIYSSNQDNDSDVEVL